MPSRRASLALIAAQSVALVIAGCSGTSTASGTISPTKPTGGASTVSTEPVARPAALDCGEQFQLPSPGPLTLTPHFPATVGRDPQPVTGSVDATSNAAVHGVGPGRAEAFLVRDGRVVTMPVAQDSVGVLWDLAPGAVRTVPADVAVVSCEGDGTELEPGAYQLYVRVVLTPGDGPPVASYGGPSPVQLQ